MEAHFDQYPKRIFVGSAQVEDGTRMLGSTVRGQNGERWQRKSNGFRMRVWTRAGRYDVVASCRYKPCILKLYRVATLGE